MDKDLLKNLAEKISSQENDIGSTVRFDTKKYKAISFDLKLFSPIRSFPSSQKMCFIDGGNIEIVKGPSFSLHLVKVYAAIYQNNKRIDAQRISLLCLITTMEKGQEIFLKAEAFPLVKTMAAFGPYVVSSLDATVMQGISRCSPSHIGNIYRRLAEIEMAKEAVKKLSANDFIVLDGDLHAKVAGEQAALDALYNAADEKKVVVAALAKTSDWVTNTGYPVIAAINRLAGQQDETTWVYAPLAENRNELHKAELFIAKLIGSSKHSFRVDIHSSADPNELFSMLKMNSSDPSFPGYPYGLLEAHLFAKCSYQEKEYIATKLLASNEKKPEFDNLMSASNAHEMLDKM